jgi:WD40 repeat protein
VKDEEASAGGAQQLGKRWFVLINGKTGSTVTRIELPAEFREPPLPFLFPVGPFQNIAFSPDSRAVALCAGSVLYEWETNTGRMFVRSDVTPVGSVGSPKYVADGARVVCTGADGAYVEWEAATGHVLANRKLPRPITVSPDGSQFAREERNDVRGTNAASIVITDAAGHVRNRLTGHTGIIWEADFSPDGTLLVTSGVDAVRVWAARVDRAQTAVSRER